MRDNIYINRERIKYSPKSINYQVTRTRRLIGIQQVLFSHYVDGARLSSTIERRTFIYIYMNTHNTI